MSPQELIELLRVLALNVWGYTGVKVIVCHTLINVVVAVAAAVHSNEFELGRIGEFLYRKLAPFVLIYYVVKVAGEAAGLGYLAPVVWGVIEATLMGDLLDNWSRLGLPLPSAAQRYVVKR